MSEQIPRGGFNPEDPANFEPAGLEDIKALYDDTRAWLTANGEEFAEEEDRNYEIVDNLPVVKEGVGYQFVVPGDVVRAVAQDAGQYLSIGQDIALYFRPAHYEPMDRGVLYYREPVCRFSIAKDPDQSPLLLEDMIDIGPSKIGERHPYSVARMQGFAAIGVRLEVDALSDEDERAGEMRFTKGECAAIQQIVDRLDACSAASFDTPTDP